MPKLKFKVDENERVPSSSELFWSWLKYHGLRYTFDKSREAILKKLDVFAFMRDNLALAGVVNQKEVYCGPELVEIDLTNNCNCHCAGCWCHSLLLGDDMLKGRDKTMHLPLDLITRLIDHLRGSGTKAVQISGSGEPFMHPDIMDILSYIKVKGMKCSVITNFTLITEDKVRKLVDMGLDNITASVWAGTAATYVKTHPGMREDDFQRMEKMLKLLNCLKNGRPFPRVKIYNVISTLNFHEIEEMLNFALRVRADFLEFTVMDTIAGKTDVLALSDSERESIVKQCFNMEDRIDYPRSPQWGVEIKQVKLLDRQHKQEILGFGKYRKLPFSQKEERETGASGGEVESDEVFRDSEFNFELKQLNQMRVWCPAGNSTHWQHYDENLNAFIFRFTMSQCGKCSLRYWCLRDKGPRKVQAKYLSLLGFGTFYRRVMNMESLGQDKKDTIVDTLPCYAGWSYSRVRVNGDVTPCCKAHRMPVGNLYKEDFRKIWTSPKQRAFRKNALLNKKSDPYFSNIECYKGCDNLGSNLEIHKRAVALTDTEKRVMNFMKVFFRVV